MTLYELPTGRTARILRLEGDPVLTKRLYSFGLEPETLVCVTQKSIGEANLKLRCRDTLIALRKEEARAIIIKEEA